MQQSVAKCSTEVMNQNDYMLNMMMSLQEHATVRGEMFYGRNEPK